MGCTVIFVHLVSMQWTPEISAARSVLRAITLRAVETAPVYRVQRVIMPRELEIASVCLVLRANTPRELEILPALFVLLTLIKINLGKHLVYLALTVLR